MYYNYNNISHNLFYIKIKKLPWEKVNREPSSADYDNLLDQQIQIIYTFGCIHQYTSILKSVEEIHLRLYQSHKDPKFPGASGHSLCSRQIQIVVYLTIPCKLLSANTLQFTIFYGI